MPPSQDVINTRQKYGLSPTGYKAPNPLLSDLHAAWGTQTSTPAIAQPVAPKPVEKPHTSLSILMSGIDAVAREVPGAVKDLAESSVDQTKKGLGIIGDVFKNAPTPKPIALPGGKVAPGIDPTGVLGFTEKVGEESAKLAPKVFEGFEDLSTTLLEKLKGKSKVSKQFISDLTNQPELKQTEKDLIRGHLESEADEVNVPDFANKVRAELLPLERGSTAGNVRTGEGGEVGKSMARYEGVNLPPNLRGPVSNYTEHVYQSPVKTSAGGVHFDNTVNPNYFGHTRVEDLPDTKAYAEYDSGIEAYRDKEGNIIDATEAKKNSSTRRVIEVQSDLFQKGRLEKELPTENSPSLADLPDEKRIELNKLQSKILRGELTPAESTRYSELRSEAREIGQNAVKARTDELSKLEPYKNNAAHFRMIREEVKQAAIDGKTKLQFPTGETAMKIEGLGAENNWRFIHEPSNSRHPLVPEDIQVGATVSQGDYNNPWIITDVLGDGKFKAVPKDSIEEAVMENGIHENNLSTQEQLTYLEHHDNRVFNNQETFDISGKVDTENPIYKFYEKEVGKYLKNKYNAQLITDPQGVKWWEIPVNKEEAGKPITAFSFLPLLAGLGVGGAAATDTE